MALGFLNKDFRSKVLPYNDEKTPIDLSGKKMLPIMDFSGKVMNESLDIIFNLDPKNALGLQTLSILEITDMENLLTKLGKDIHSLCMPHWINTQEFDEKSRDYFKVKKEAKRGPFTELVKNSDTFTNKVLFNLKDLDDKVESFFNGKSFTVLDIMLASHVWGLYIVPSFKFPDNWSKYLEKVKSLTNFDYHRDFKEL